MNRTQFMEELEGLLFDMLEEEKQDALSFYQNYFDDAGREQEDAVIKELGTPQQVAAIIKGIPLDEDEIIGEYTEVGYEDSRYEDKQELGYGVKGEQKKESWFRKKFPKKENKEKIKSERNWWKILSIFLLVLVGWPLIIVAAVLWLVIAVFMDFLTVMLALLGIGIFIGGIVLFIAGIGNLFTSPIVGLLMCVGGIAVIVIGIMLAIFMIKIAIKTLPIAFRKAINIIRKPFHSRKEKSENA